jgi:O-antigen ligase
MTTRLSPFASTMAATVSVPVPRLLATHGFAIYTGAVVTLAMLFGGGARQGLLSDVLVELAALPLLAWSAVRLRLTPLSRLERGSLVLAGAVLALPLLQVVLLPPALWSALPGRTGIVAGYAAADMSLPWLPVSLDPVATWRSLFALLPALAVFLASLSLDNVTRRLLMMLVLGFVLLSVPLDLLQMMGGQGSSLRFYAITNSTRAVGFFANSNHHAALLYCAVPFAVGLMLVSLRESRERRMRGLLFSAAVLAGITLALPLTVSRAGLALGLLAALACLLLAWRTYPANRRILLGVLAGNVVAGLVVFQMAFVAVVDKTEVAVHDMRWPAAEVTAQAAVATMPFGTGIGTFVPVFQAYSSRDIIRDRYLNHAHDDWLELWLTGGVPALLLVVAFLVWFALAALPAWRAAQPGLSLPDVMPARAASIAVILLLLHSAVDYPLRTIAMEVALALACAVMMPKAGRAAA